MKMTRAEPTTAEARDVFAEAEREGVDLTLLVENLRLTPEERIKRNEGTLSFILDLREAADAKRRKADSGPAKG